MSFMFDSERKTNLNVGHRGSSSSCSLIDLRAPTYCRRMTTQLEDISVRSNDGQPSSLGAYAGKVRLVVNVASKCGLTPQYEGLEALYKKYKDRGFEVLAFPANEFGAQEPGTDAEIKTFCSSTYDVSFPLFAKIVVKGEGQHPLYANLTSAQPEARTTPGSDFRAKLIGYGIDPGGPSEILWNFEKFLVDRKGDVVERFAPDMAPSSDTIVAAIERELAR
jgi:glutathione peroxidase